MGQSLSLAAFERTRDVVLLALRAHLGDGEASLLSRALEVCRREDPDANGWLPSSSLDRIVQELGLRGRWSRFEIDAFARMLVVMSDELEIDDSAPRTSARLNYELFLEVIFFPIPVAKARPSLQLNQQAVVETGRCLVYEGEYNGRSVTAREFRLGSNTDDTGEAEVVRSIRWNLGFLRLVSHPNLVRYIATLEAKRSLYIIEEIYPSCTLRTILESFGPMKEATIRRYATQVLDAVCCLHRHDVTHGNLRLESIHINSSGLVKLSNYGINWNKISISEHKVNALAIDWMNEFQPPERLKPEYSEEGTKPGDVWSLGILLLVMAYGVGKDAEEAFRGGVGARAKIGRNVAQTPMRVAGVPPFPSSMTKGLREIIKKCIQPNPRARPAVRQLLEMDFFRVDQGTTAILREVCSDLDASIQRLTASTSGSQSSRSSARQSSTKPRVSQISRTPSSLTSHHI